jgi:hypothetical protein
MKKMLMIILLCVPMVLAPQGKTSVPVRIYATWTGSSVKAHDPILGIPKQKRKEIIKRVWEENYMKEETWMEKFKRATLF